MPTELKTTAQLNLLYDKYSSFFEQNTSPSFHNLLWQIIVNRRFDEKIIIFSAVVPNHDGRGFEIGLAENGDKGYIPTGVCFMDNIAYNQATSICKDISKELFGIEGQLYSIIELQAM